MWGGGGGGVNVAGGGGLGGGGGGAADPKTSIEILAEEIRAARYVPFRVRVRVRVSTTYRVYYIPCVLHTVCMQTFFLYCCILF